MQRPTANHNVLFIFRFVCACWFSVCFRIKLNVYISVIHWVKTLSALNDSITSVRSRVTSDLFFLRNANLLDVCSNQTSFMYVQYKQWECKHINVYCIKHMLKYSCILKRDLIITALNDHGVDFGILCVMVLIFSVFGEIFLTW